MGTGYFDIVVIGSGVIGYSIAFRLKQDVPHLKIAVLGDPVNSLQASRAAAGMLAPFCECDRADQFFRFCRDSLYKFPKFLSELFLISGVPVHFSPAGSLMPSSSYRENWEERKAFFTRQNIQHEIWNIETVRQNVPYLSVDCGEVMWVGEGQVNNRQMHDSLMVASKKLGIHVLETNVSDFILKDLTIASAVTDSGNIVGKQFVLASGSWSSELARVLEVSIPLKPIKGQMCRVQLDDYFMNYTLHGRLTYIAPWREGNGFVIGSTMEDRGFDPSIESEVIDRLIDKAAKILPALKTAPLIESWTGLRPAAEDLMPIMGKSTKYDNLFYSSGHYRNGILMTPNQADYMSGVIRGTLANEILEFSPNRYNL
jgi:glycine oxidase ThiO